MTSPSGFSVLSRRRFLRWSLGAGALASASLGGLFALRGRAPHVAGLAVLSAHEYRTLVHLAQALFPGANGVDEVDLALQFDRFLADEPAWNRSDLKRALFLLEYGPVLFDRRLSTFSYLSPEERVAHFAAWASSDSPTRRQVSVAFRRFLALAYYDRPEAWMEIGYDGPRPEAVGNS